MKCPRNGVNSNPFGDLAVSASFGSITPAGATITLTDAATGTFTYNPPAGFSGPASFQFQVCDDGAPAPPAMCSAPARVSFTVTGPDLWFVDATAAAGGSGRLTDPFGTLASLPAARGNGDRIFVFTGTYGTGHTLLTSEQLIGQGSSGTFDSVLGVTVPGNGTFDTRPALGGTRPQLNGMVTVGGSSVVRGLNIVTVGATGLSGGAAGGVTVNEAGVSANTATAVNLNGTGVTLTRVDSSGGVNGIVLNSNPAGSFTVTGTGAPGTGGTIQTSSDNGIKASNVAGLSLSHLNVTNNGNSTVDHADEGIDLNNLVGTASITNTSVTLASHHNLFLDNSSGTLTSLTITGSSFNSAVGGGMASSSGR